MKNEKILCDVSEKSKIVVNRCLDLGYEIGVWKLEQLMIIIQGIMLVKYNKPFFEEKIISVTSGLVIRQIERDFIVYTLRFNEKLPEYIYLLEDEEEIVDEVIKKYGDKDYYDLKNSNKIKLLSEICYEKTKMNCVPNEMIKQVFEYYSFSLKNKDLEDEVSFQKNWN